MGDGGGVIASARAYSLPSGAVDRPRTAPGVAPELTALGDRFWSRVTLTGPEADPRTCWHYTNQPSRDAEGRPPFFTIRSDTIPAARVAWELTGHGSVAGQTLTPTCGDVACCRPRHQGRREYRHATRYGRSVLEIARGHRAALGLALTTPRAPLTLVSPTASPDPLPLPATEPPDPGTADVVHVLQTVQGGQLRDAATVALHDVAATVARQAARSGPGGAARGAVVLSLSVLCRGGEAGGCVVEGAVTVRPPRPSPADVGPQLALDLP